VRACVCVCACVRVCVRVRTCVRFCFGAHCEHKYNPSLLSINLNVHTEVKYIYRSALYLHRYLTLIFRWQCVILAFVNVCLWDLEQIFFIIPDCIKIWKNSFVFVKTFNNEFLPMNFIIVELYFTYFLLI